MIVVADTTPLNYLILIGQIQLLPRLYGQVFAPPAVLAELSDPRSPSPVRQWIAQTAEWLHVRSPQSVSSDFPHSLGPGEREAITLSQELQADAVLLDEWDGRIEAQRRHLTVIGTLRILGEAAEQNLIDLPGVIARLRTTNFRARESLIQEILARYTKQ